MQDNTFAVELECKENQWGKLTPTSFEVETHWVLFYIPFTLPRFGKKKFFISEEAVLIVNEKNEPRVECLDNSVQIYETIGANGGFTEIETTVGWSDEEIDIAHGALDEARESVERKAIEAFHAQCQTDQDSVVYRSYESVIYGHLAQSQINFMATLKTDPITKKKVLGTIYVGDDPCTTGPFLELAKKALASKVKAI